ncbi:MAG: CHC2 zinc finger domain-containing protein [Candidatus Staskawiczbacteria bacterium]|nr:CHC2 zinc finger domain-containing protein [Candidatus Staskawiczbacteria bacterium]
MPDSQIEEIKNKLNVLDVVGSYVKLSKTGINYRGLCPFHTEKGPSFFVSPGRQMWKCFGCGKGGDIFEFIKEIEGVEFGDALRLLASKAGVELKRENPQVVSERKRLYEICDLACSFFEKQLQAGSVGKPDKSPEGHFDGPATMPTKRALGGDAKEYLLNRGITEESIAKWRLGYSPDTWQGLSDFLVGRGYNREEIVKAGLAVQSDKGNNPYDRFRGRIIFPIFDLNSQVIGFSARIFPRHSGVPLEAGKDGMGAKYINTPQTMLYDKSNVLYGMNYAKLAIRKQNNCVLTEGNTDAIMCHQAGFENTIAVSGTALTQRHLSILKRYSENLIFAFDMDLAGDTATKRGISLAESQGFNIKIIDTYSGAKDPAEIILENPENWQNSMVKARSIMDFYFDSTFAKFDKNNPKDKKEIGKIILPAIKRLQNKIEQSHWVQKLAEKLGVSHDAVLQELKDTKIENINLATPEVNKVILSDNPIGRKKMLEDKIISLVLKNPENLNLIEDCHNCLFCDRTKSLIGNIKNSAMKRGNDSEAIFADLKQDEYKELFDTLSFMAEVEYDNDGLDEIQLCLNHLKDINTREKRTTISGEIKKAELAGDFEKVNNLIKEFNLIN